MSNSRLKEHSAIVADILARTALKPNDLVASSRLHLNKLGKSETDHWLAYIEKTNGTKVAGNGVVHSLIDLIVQSSLGSKTHIYQELKTAIDNLSNGIDPDLTKKKLAKMSDVERQTIAEDLKRQKVVENETAYKIAVRQEAIKAVFG